MRLPHQVLGFPYKKDENGNYLYAVFLRNSKKEVWQGIAGGVEDFDKSYLDAFKREAYEEANISFDSKVIPLKVNMYYTSRKSNKKIYIWRKYNINIRTLIWSRSYKRKYKVI